MIIAMAVIPDSSGDGIRYHQEAVFQMIDGWNPFADINPPVDDPGIKMLVVNYAMGLETAAAVVGRFTGSIDSGKLVNLLLIVGTWFVAYSFLRRRWPECRKTVCFFISTLVIANPVGLGQAFSYYNDFAVYYYIILTIIVFAYNPSRLTKTQIAALGGIIVISIATKFTAFFYEGLTILAVMVWYLLKSNHRLAWKIALYSFIAAVIGVLIFSYHPYVSNTIYCGHPFYPLMGEGAIDIMTGNTPPHYLESNRFVNFFASLTSVVIPDLQAREGGFGLFMPVILVLGILLLWKECRKNRSLSIYLYVALWSFCACFIFEQSWWARYVPFLWLLPVSAVIGTIEMGGVWASIRKTIIALGILSGMMLSAITLYVDLRLMFAQRYILELSEGQPLDVSAPNTLRKNVEHHLKEMNRPYRFIKPQDTDNKIAVAFQFDIVLEDNSIVYFDSSKREEVRRLFTQSLPAKIFRLHHFIPDSIKR